VSSGVLLQGLYPVLVVKKENNEGMNQFGVKYIYLRKFHSETPCKTIINKNVFKKKN
jgi:hypothetical protein